MPHFKKAERRQSSSFSPRREIRLSDAYSQGFEVIPADTPALVEKAYRLRYQVYCCEHHFETPDDYPLPRETDEFDSRAVHCLLVSRVSGAVAGTVRLILPDERAPETSFPIQEICDHPMFSDPMLMSTSAEVSRFAISKQVRKTLKDPVSFLIGEHGDNAVDGRELKCCIVLGLMKATLQMSFRYGITDWFAVMEPSLLRLLSRFSIYFSPVGPLVAYHGMRQPCYANVFALLERVHQEFFELWEFVTESCGACEEVGVALS